MSPDGRRRNIWLPDEVWAAVVEAAAHDTLSTGEQISASEWIRRAIAKDLTDRLDHVERE